MFIVGRAIAGMGSAGVGNGAYIILSASIPLAKRACTFSRSITHTSQWWRTNRLHNTVYFSIGASCMFF